MIVVEARFNGPPGSGNGGYTAGLVASALGSRAGIGAGAGGAVVTLRVPPPLDTPLRLTGDGKVYAGDRLVAQVAPAELAGEPVPPPVRYAEAEAAAAGYPGLVDHPFPTCYVCGPERAAGDGLRIFPGPLPGGGTAAPWLVPDDVSAVTMWAALDCPGGWAIIGPGRPYLLGRIAASVTRVPAPGTRCVVRGEVVTTAGRKAEVRTAVYRPDGELLARARATWIAVPANRAPNVRS